MAQPTAAAAAAAAATATAAAPHVVLIGDSTLDNVKWVRGAAESVPELLKRRLRRTAPDAEVTNLAADGFTTSDVLNGAPAAISFAARAAAGDPFPTASPLDHFFPLERLEALAPRAQPTHLVLSVGGNDIREVLGSMHELPARIAAFQLNYPRIAAACESSGAQVIVMMQYRPDLITDFNYYGVYRAVGEGVPGSGDAVEKLNRVMEGIYPPVLSLALQKGWDVIDLPNSFDIYNTELYLHQIEPSPAGGALIAELIAHAVLRRPGGRLGGKAGVPAASRTALMISKPPNSDRIVERPLVTTSELNVVADTVSASSWRVKRWVEGNSKI